MQAKYKSKVAGHYKSNESVINLSILFWLNSIYFKSYILTEVGRDLRKIQHVDVCPQYKYFVITL